MLSATLLDYLVVDTGPLIRNIKLDNLAKQVVTTRGVVQEVRDARTRRRLEMLPMDIDQHTPSDKCIEFVQNFAQLTGDVRSLSATDIAVIALTYDLESRLNGTDHLRKEPVNSIKVNEGFGDHKITNLAGFYVPKKSKSSSNSRTTSISSNMTTDTQTTDTQTDTQTDTLADSLDHCELEEGWTTVPGRDKGDMLDIIDPEDMFLAAAGEEEDYFSSSDEDNEEDWITPSNITSKQTESLAEVRVGCSTTDFAMQNVLLQIGLHVVSVDGMLIKHAKTYVLKCSACFTVVRDCARLFCTRCGNKTLEKVAVTVDEEGVTWYQRLSRKPRTRRGVRYSLPKPKGGRNAAMPYITEDQPDQVHKMKCEVKSGVDVMSGDFVKSGSPFGVTNVDARAFRFHQVAGKHGNPNERAKRTGNRKKKKK